MKDIANHIPSMRGNAAARQRGISTFTIRGNHSHYIIYNYYIL